MSKPVFPTTNLCGELFNDLLNEKPILEIYVEKGEVIWSSDYSTVIDLEQSKDRIHISHYDGKIRSIEYVTTSKKVIKQMITFLNTHFKKEPTLEKNALDIYDIYNADVLVFVSRSGTTHYIGIRII